MVLNIILLVAGIISLIFGIRNKLKLWIVVGCILILCGSVSAYMDYKMPSVEDPNGRVPFMIDKF
ncbi:MAG: hypothetical protein KBT01_02680 [Clostridiales bacterium]|nr:hypothetical protein [Candidatus Blautia equi]